MGTTDRDFAEWYRAEHSRVIGSMVLLCGDRELANEVTDEAFARALSRWGRVGNMASPGGWTYRVALNLLRRTKRRQRLEASRVAMVASEVPAIADHHEVWEAVAVLPERQRQAVVLRYVADLPEADIAIAMKISRGTVASHLSDAREALARFLGETEVEEAST